MIVNDHLESARSKLGVPQGPSLFSDFEMPAIDMLSYVNNKHFSVSTSPTTGVTLAAYLAKHENRIIEGMVTEFDFGQTHIEGRIDTVSQFSATLKWNRTSPFTKNIVKLRLPNYTFSTYHLQSFHEYATLAMSVPLINDSATETELSTTVGTPHAAFGMGTKYHSTIKHFSMYDAGISMTKPNYDASITLRNRGDFIRASYIHYFGRERKVSAAAMISRVFSEKENRLVVGGSWTMNDLTTIKARFDNSGMLVTLLQHKIKSKSKITISSKFDASGLHNIPAIGIALSLVF